jgi:hypothetical protein
MSLLEQIDAAIKEGSNWKALEITGEVVSELIRRTGLRGLKLTATSDGFIIEEYIPKTFVDKNGKLITEVRDAK